MPDKWNYAQCAFDKKAQEKGTFVLSHNVITVYHFLRGRFLKNGGATMRIKSFCTTAFCALALAGCASRVGPQSTTPSPDASYIFLGTVLAPAVDDDKPNVSVHNVRVDQTYFQRGTFDDQTGRVIELTGDSVPASGQFVFHTEPYRFGKLVAAVLIDTDKPRRYTGEEVHELKRSIRRKELLKRVKGAELIVVGRSEATREWRGPVGVESEHDPYFTWAKITVDEVLRGRIEGGTQEFLFAASDDVHWFRAPKVGVGKAGLFLLRRGVEGADLNVGKAWTLLHPHDFLTGEDVEIIRLILKEGGVQ